MYKFFEEINSKPKLYSVYQPELLWNDEHISKILLQCHLNEDSNVASRNKKFIEESANFINKKFKLNGKKVLDLGCGPGLYCELFAKQGANVTGIDFSKNSIKYAQKQNIHKKLNISYICGDYTKLDLKEKYDIITLIYCDLCALPPQIRKSLLIKIHKSLLSGGVFIFDVFSYSAFQNLEEHHEYSKNLHNGFWSNNEYYGFMNTFLYKEEAIELGKYTLVYRDSIKTIYNWLKYFKPEEIKKELEEAGFSKIEFWGDLTGRHYSSNFGDFGVIAQ